MSDREALLQELQKEPDEVARKLLDYLHALKKGPDHVQSAGPAGGHFESYWKRYYGAFE